MLRCSILVFFFFFSYLLFAQQTYERRLSISEWIKEMVNCEDSVYRLENAEIYYDKAKDKSYLDSTFSLLWKGKESSFAIPIKHEIQILNCHFEEYPMIDLIRLDFKRRILIEKCYGLTFRFYKCKFNGFVIGESNIERFEIYMCTINNAEIFMDRHFSQIGISLYRNEIDHFRFRKCLFKTNENKEKFYSIFYNYAANGYIDDLSIDNCKFETKKSPLVFSFDGSIRNLQINNTQFSNTIVDFENTTIEKSIIIDKSEFPLPIGVGNFSFPEKNTNVHWNMLKGNKICLYDKRDPYLAKSDSEIVNLFKFNELISAYKSFFSMYKTRGDMESANGCYIEMKDIETRRLKFLYKQNPTIQSFFKLRLNQFLKIFCDYGTNPVKSLIISMYVVLAFALFYFFFYSDWDRINRSFLMRRYNKLLHYFRSEQKLEDFYTEEHREEFQSYEEFKENIRQSKKEIPFFINLLGKPLYHLSVIKHNMMGWLYRRTEILSGRWIDLKPVRKFAVGSTVGLAILVYMVYLVCLRSLNSLFLSINTFSTLGFGDIPVKGISRYIAILEGFLGWFLLSIFSVSLISQILQN